MKNFKKIISVFLVVLMVFSFAAFVANAEDNIDLDKLKQNFIKYLDEYGVVHTTALNEEMADVSYIVNSNDWNVFIGKSGQALSTTFSKRIGDYIFTSSSCESPYKLGIYAEKNGMIITLEAAYGGDAIDFEVIGELCGTKIDTDTVGVDVLKQEYIDYCAEKGVFYDSKDLNSNLILIITESNGYTLFYTNTPFGSMNEFEIIGKYVFNSSGFYAPYALGIYAGKDGELLTLQEAYTEGKINIDDVADATYNEIARILGDTNGDKKIDMIDVVNLQKRIAKIQIIQDRFYYCVYNYNWDNAVDMKDVVQMQKHIAKLI